MEQSKRKFPIRVGKKLRAQFGAGILVIVPIIITILLLVWLFGYIDNIAQPVGKSRLGRTIPGLGFAFTVVLIYLTGVVATSVIGKRVVG